MLVPTSFPSFQLFKMKLSASLVSFRMFVYFEFSRVNAAYFNQKLDFSRIRSHGSFASFCCLSAMVVLIFTEVDDKLELGMLPPRVSTPTAMAGVVLISEGEWTVCDQSGDGT
jgi:hypothetical protein